MIRLNRKSWRQVKTHPDAISRAPESGRLRATLASGRDRILPRKTNPVQRHLRFPAVRAEQSEARVYFATGRLEPPKRASAVNANGNGYPRIRAIDMGTGKETTYRNGGLLNHFDENRGSMNRSVRRWTRNVLNDQGARKMVDRNKRDNTETGKLSGENENSPCNHSPQPMSDAPPEAVIHELQTRQYELMLQNETLLQAHVELAESRDRYAELFDHAPVGYIALNHEGLIAEVNMTANVMLGVTRRACIGRGFADFVAADERDFWSTQFAGMVKNASRQRFNLSLEGADGQKIHARFLGIVQASSISDMVVWLIFIDVSDRLAAEDQLRKLSLAVEQSPDSIMITNLQGIIEFVNPAFTLISGYTADEVINRTPRMLQSGLTPEETYRSLWQTLARGEIWRGEFVNRRKDGLYSIEAATISPLRQADGKVTHYVSVQKDITELKRTLTELIASRNRLQLAQEAGGFGIFDRDIASGQLDWDARTRAICGVDPDTPINFATFLEMVHPDDRGKIHTAIERAMKPDQGNGVYRVEYRILNRKTGEERTLMANGQTFFEAGRPTRLVGTIQDITQQRAMEAELKNRRRAMDRLVDQQVAAQTASAIAHEINQPLASISAYSEAAINMLRAGHLDKLEHALHGAVTQSQRAGQALHELLEFLQEGEIVLEPTDLNEVIHEALVEVEDTGYADFHTMVDLTPDLKPVMANRLQLQKVLINLIINGVDAMREADISPAKITIRVRTTVDHDMAMTTIQDSGPGMSAETAKRIFNPFFTTKSNGIGLGLAISRALIEAQGGRLWVDLESGESGAVFHFTLPFAS